MASSAITIAPLNVVNAETDESWKIKVKIVRLWKQTYTNNLAMVASIDMVLMDEQGNKIQATVKRNLFPQFEMLLLEGAVRVISNFGLASNTGKFLLTQHKCKINFYRTTVVRICTDWDSDEQQFDFMSFTDILAQKRDPIYAFDVIGEVIWCDSTKVLSTKGGQYRIKTVHLQDTQGVKLNLALWDNYADQLTTFLADEKNKDTSVILLLEFAKSGEWGIK
uniref:replication protein A 70 kDa DNA-binding subunit-like n=1 Tax=Erigeron canadensis TaxID=72917 RepID=UPI001CB98E9F|nr:replication protein A 70 kDa DNA-binding subunit-like [Erigeron canadensis]